jgi:pyruvate,water dikinase
VLVRWFSDIGSEDEPTVGGKAVSLGTLSGLGLRVPEGFALPVDAYRRSRDHAGLDSTLAALLADVDFHDMTQVSDRAGQARQAISSMSMDADVVLAVSDAYAQLCSNRGTPDLPVAVRSSARGEDSADASFAGEHDTFLWVRGEAAVIDAVRRCWASLFTDRAVCYRAEVGQEHVEAAMGVIVQEMVMPVAAGVAFTLDPANGDRSVIAIDSAWGLGEGVVSGEVTPDSFRVDKVMRAITARSISVKGHEYRLGDDEVVKAVVGDDRAATPSLTDEQVLEVARIARIVERHQGCPQDLEWAVLDRSLTDVTVLQSRPETVWSRTTTRHGAVDSSGDYMSGIVSTLMSPLYIREHE